MTRKPWMFAALLVVSLATSRLMAQEQFGPPATGNTSAILFAPATLNLVAGSFTAGYGGDGGPANSATAMLSYPVGIAYDSNGNLFVADEANHVVRRIDHGTGDISTFAGQQANPGFSIGGGVATSAQMQGPSGLVVDTNNNVYVADRFNNVVFKITPAGVISIFAGSGNTGYGGDGGSATAPAAEFNGIWALGIDSSNNIYIADSSNNLIRKVTQAGQLSTFAGDVADVSACSSNQYSTGAPPYTALQVHLCAPEGVAFDPLGNTYITDTKNDVIYKVDNSGNLTLFAGTFNTPGFAGDAGPATSAWFDVPTGLYVDPAGRLYISDFFNGRIRVVDTLGNINTVFGDGFGSLNKNSIGEPDTEALNVTAGPANGIYDFVLDQEGNIIATDSSSNAVTSAGSTGQYVFSDQFVFSPSLAKYVTVENPSGVPLDFLGTPTITGPYSLATGASAGNCNFSGTLPAGQTCTIGIIFTPIVDDAKNPGSLTLTTNANSSPSTISLFGMSYGTGTTSASLTGPGPSYTAIVGQTSASQAATLTNTGQTAITITSTAFGGIGPAFFAIGSTTCPTSPATLASGASCVYNITFTPTNTTTESASFTVTVANYGMLGVTLDGVGTAAGPPTASLSPNPLAFGGQVYNTTSPPQAVVLSNTGGGALTGIVPTITGMNPGDFAILTTGTNACGNSLAAGASCNIWVTFTPINVGSLQATLSVADNASPSPQTVALTGTYVYFYSNVGSALAAQPVSVYIATAGVASAINVLTQGAPNLDFTMAPGGSCAAGTDYPVGKICTVNVIFNPLAPGARLGSVLLTDASGNVLGTTYLPGVGGAAEIVYNTGVQSTLPAFSGGNYSGPFGVTVDSSLNVYVADSAHGWIIKTPWTGTAYGAPVKVPTGSITLVNPSAVAVDGSGNVFIADTGGFEIVEVPWNGTSYGTAIVLDALDLPAPEGIAVDMFGNLFFSDSIDNKVVEMLWTGSGYGAPTTLAVATGLHTPTGLTVDSNQNLFIADSGDNQVVEVPWTVKKGYVSETVVDDGLDFPEAVAVDAAGDLYIANTNAGTVVELPFTFSSFDAQFTLDFSGLGTSNGMTIDSNGSIYVSDATKNDVVMLNLSNPPSLTFASTAVGSTSADSPQTVTVWNIGSGSLTIQSANYPANFVQNNSDKNLCLSDDGIGSGASCDVSVSFTPTTSGSLSGAVVLTDNNLNGKNVTQSIQVSGAATGAPAPAATLTPSIAFASAQVATTSSALSATLTNTGNATLNITGIAIAGTNPSDFAIATGANACGTTLAANASCSIYVTFTPASATSFSATLSVADNAAGSPQTSALTGTGTTPPAPVASLTPATVPFGSLTVGSTSAAVSATLSNTGNATLNITGITIAGANPADFAIATGSNACGSTLAADASCSIYVTFTPASASGFTATLQVADNAAGSPQTSTLTGTGTAPPAPVATFAPNPVAFASQAIGATSAATTVTLTNSGNATLTITGITITGTNPTDFATTTGSNSCDGSISAGASCNIYVTFTPAAAASYSATLSVADNAAGSPQTVALSGSAINPADFSVSATPASQTVQPGGSTSFNVSVASSGGTFGSPVGLTVSGLPPGATGSFSPSSVTPGSESASSTLTVQTGLTPQQTARNSVWPLAAPALAALGLLFLPGKRRRRWITLGALLLASLGTLTALSGCGGGFSFVQPSQTYTLTISGTSGNDTHSTTVQLTVQ